MNKKQFIEKILEVVEEYTSQFDKDDNDSDNSEITVCPDDDGDFIDQCGNIWDIEKEEMIGTKDSETGKKTLFKNK